MLLIASRVKKPSAPKVPGKNALIFVTYSGPHTGIEEATPVGKDIRQFFEHLCFNVIDEWYVLSEFHGSLENSTKGRMGDIRGKPTKEDLQKIKEDAKRVTNLTCCSYPSCLRSPTFFPIKALHAV